MPGPGEVLSPGPGMAGHCTNQRNPGGIAVMNLLDQALAYAEAGYSVIPTRPDGTKAPAAFWKQYQTTRATPDQLRAWLASGQYDGIGLICGAISGNLELFELEGRAIGEGVHTQLAQALTDNGFADLWARLNAGYIEVTPASGLHWLFRVDGPAQANTKLASRPSTPDELATDPHKKVQVLIETRGEGGYVVVAPSTGRTHPSGKPWILAAGGINTIPTISTDERDALYAVAATLNQIPAEPDHPPIGRTHLGDASGDRPGDDFNARADWADILGPHNWTLVHGFASGERTWRRPGKTHGISATTGYGDRGDFLYIFSTSTEFQAETAYSKFRAYTLLEHDGDYTAAAKALRGQGYGKPLEPTRPIDVAGLIAPTNGSSALAHQPAADADELTEPVSLDDHRRRRHPTQVTYERSDDGNALALIDQYGDQIRYCPDRERWLAWNGARWQWCPARGGIVREYGKQIARALADDDPAAVRHKQRALSAAGITAMLAQAETDERIAVAVADLDAHPWELNTPSGIVDLRTGEIHPSDPAKLHTRITPCSPDPTTDPARWHQFLIDTFGDDTELVAYLQRLIGYSAVGVVGPHILPFCFGSGGNGKGVFLESVTAVLGDYATTAPSGFLMARRHDQHETEIARLAGARMVLCSEVNEDDKFDEAKVKQLTGGDTLTARFMRADHFTFRATHQLWLMGNSRPSVKAGGRSFWRRLRLIGFENEVPPEKEVDDLQGILATEHGPALLAWIVAGAVAYFENGLQEPESVKAATEEYAREEDTVARFLDEQCHLGGGTQVKVAMSEVRRRYEAWCSSGGDVPVTAKTFGSSLKNRFGIGEARGGQGRKYYVGLTLLAEDTGEGGGDE